MLDRAVNALGRNERWTLVPVKGQPAGIYQISSDNTPRLCMDLLWGTEGTTVNQFDCKEPGDPSLANQLWQPIYDPETGGFKIVQPATGKLLARSDATLATGTAIQALVSPPDGTSRWTLMP